MTQNAHSQLLQAIEATCTAFAALDAALGMELPSHGRSCGLMVRGELGFLIRRLSYIASLAGTPDKAIASAKRSHNEALKAEADAA